LIVIKKQTRPKIVVFGLYKTGTTALFSNIKNSLDYRPRCLFEAKEYILNQEDSHLGVLAKVILGANDTNYASFQSFDKRILIIRDPRDWVISSCIFVIQEIPEIYLNSRVLDHIRKYLLQKEEYPDRYSFCDLLEFILGFTSLKTMNAFRRWVDKLHKNFINFSQSDQCEFEIYYEDFIDRKVERLSQYLEVEISDDLTLAQNHAHVPRTKGYGNWRDWMTKKDIDMLKPLFESYLAHFGYDPDFTLHEQPIIRAEDCSEYVDRVIDLKLRRT